MSTSSRSWSMLGSGLHKEGGDSAHPIGGQCMQMPEDRRGLVGAKGTQYGETWGSQGQGARRGWRERWEPHRGS